MRAFHIVDAFDAVDAELAGNRDVRELQVRQAPAELEEALDLVDGRLDRVFRRVDLGFDAALDGVEDSEDGGLCLVHRIYDRRLDAVPCGSRGRLQVVPCRGRSALDGVPDRLERGLCLVAGSLQGVFDCVPDRGGHRRDRVPGRFEEAFDGVPYGFKNRLDRV